MDTFLKGLVDEFVVLAQWRSPPFVNVAKGWNLTRCDFGIECLLSGRSHVRVLVVVVLACKDLVGLKCKTFQSVGVIFHPVHLRLIDLDVLVVLVVLLEKTKSRQDFPPTNAKCFGVGFLIVTNFCLYLLQDL